MSETQPLLPREVERKLSNRNDDSWYEYDGEPLFSPEGRERIKRRFRQMRNTDYEKLFTPKGGSTEKTKIRTSDLKNFRSDLSDAVDTWIDDHGERLTSFGNATYGEILDDYRVVKIHEEKPRKTVLWAEYDSGYRAFLGGADGKKQSILLPIRTFEQYTYHTEVVEPLFAEYNDKYPY